MQTSFIISGSPHIHTADSVDRRMWNVVIALVPSAVVSLLFFGLPALLVLAVSIGACLLTEWVIASRVMHRTCTLGNGSALITGILLAFNLPSILPWWMVVIGAVVSIGIGKMSFGGLGCNIWNPALVGRVFLLLSFPAAMTTWPEMQNGIDGVTGATIHIPDSLLGSAALDSSLAGANPLLEIMTGGMLLGAVFMATDYVTSPMTHRGQLIYGVLIGVVTMIIRLWGAYPEGVSFAILLGNSATPLLNKYCTPRRFGARKKKKNKEERGAKS